MPEYLVYIEEMRLSLALIAKESMYPMPTLNAKTTKRDTYVHVTSS